MDGGGGQTVGIKRHCRPCRCPPRPPTPSHRAFGVRGSASSTWVPPLAPILDRVNGQHCLLSARPFLARTPIAADAIAMVCHVSRVQGAWDSLMATPGECARKSDAVDRQDEGRKRRGVGGGGGCTSSIKRVSILVSPWAHLRSWLCGFKKCLHRRGLPDNRGSRAQAPPHRPRRAHYVGLFRL